MKAKLVLSVEAQRYAAQADAWWQAHRPAAPDLFVSELEKALALVRNHPGIGRLVPRPERQGLRRLELRRSRYYLLYEHDEATNEVYVHAVWSAVRGRGPRLLGP